MSCEGLARYIREVKHTRGGVRVVLGYYGEIGLTFLRDGSVRVDWCNEVLLDELVKAVECAKKVLKG